MLNYKHVNKNLLIIIPTVAAFLIALIPTLQYGWPLSWDVIHHIHIANVYAQYGLTLTDPLIGLKDGLQKIGYVPLFHLFIAAVGYITKMNYFQIGRYLQPFIASGIVLSVSYVGYKFYGLIAGVSAGFMVLSSNLINRIVLTIPENMALIIFPIAVYFFYLSLKRNTYKYALISGILLIIMVFIHQGAAFLLFLTLTIYTIVAVILNRDVHIIKKYLAWVLPPVFIGLVLVGVILFLDSSIVYSILQNGISTVTGYRDSISYNYSQYFYLIPYAWQLGMVPLFFALIGGWKWFKSSPPKKITDKTALVIVWAVFIFLFSQLNVFGLNVLTHRFFIYLLLPLSILGGMGLYQAYIWGKKKKFSGLPVGHLIIIIIFLLAVINGVLLVTNPKIATFGAETKFGVVHTSPPTSSEIDLANWFNKNGDKSKKAVISNYYSGMFLVADTGQPISRDRRALTGKINQSSLIKEDIGYLVYDKRLNFSSDDKLYDKEPGGLMFFSKDIHLIIPQYAKIVYENDDFIVCKIK